MHRATVSRSAKRRHVPTCEQGTVNDSSSSTPLLSTADHCSCVMLPGGRAIVVYTVKPLSETSSQVDLSVKFLLTGALAQFSRSGLVKDVADHLTRTFARNLAARLAGAPSAQSEQQVLEAGTLARAALWGRIVRFFRNLLRS